MTDQDAALDLSVIVPSYNVEDTLADQLDALCGEPTDGRWEVIVVDNRSTDGTPAVAETYAAAHHHVRVVRAADRAGVAYARNSGVRASSARSVAFCDGDDIVEPGWVAAMRGALSEHQLVAGGLDANSLNPPELAASRPGLANERLPRFGGIPFARGNNCGMQRSVWDRLGGFEEDFVGLEDIELSLRARALDIEPVFVEGARVAYRYRAGYGDIWRQGFFYGRGRPALIGEAGRLGLTGAPSRWEGWRSWAWLVRHLPSTRHRVGRYRWVWVLANRVGVLRGSIATRSFHV